MSIYLLFVGLKPDLAMHCLMTLGVIELIFHFKNFRISGGKVLTEIKQSNGLTINIGSTVLLNFFIQDISHNVDSLSNASFN